ncbi:3-methyl-2-oxobutanoate hydroxymethyltransferase [Lacimicrobium alkaliphilum]|uniref:3-methyl-2-oxobutanoate hydroxymethyltransferase n=1 Tax=Lacimicrobium alkaliphilum TaxID=1526571 RepID=A0ABQ1R5T4_9ALTE|nr:3-methyl-2-oxobutanoate hydroxymethyltransferase [Lacimicrobium alkaliphilum]GGD59244.1 3-methyl-2-oxobutanoate hydroxymethyltransferase [Lacimicrobium alkaliphilum]
MKKVTISTLIKMKQQGERISVITAYDASFAKLFDEQGMDAILIGDSLGMVLMGEDDTLPVTTAQMAYHTRSVRKGTQRAFVIADMPFMSYATVEQSYANATQLMAAGASMVKMEGGDWLLDSVRGLTDRGIPVCGHLGLTPQSVHKLGGFRVQGREQQQAEELVNQAVALENAGALMLVLECVPSVLANRITQSLNIPVIGIGAGPGTDGQVLVMHDMLGISANYMPKFSKNYLNECGDIRKAVSLYIEEVKQGKFPTEEHSFS